MRKNAKKQVKAELENAAIIAHWVKSNSAQNKAEAVTAEEAFNLYIDNYKTVSMSKTSYDFIIFLNDSGSKSVKAYNTIEEYKEDLKYHKADISESEYSAIVENTKRKTAGVHVLR